MFGKPFVNVSDVGNNLYTNKICINKWLRL